MNLMSIRLIVRDLKQVVAFYESVTTLKARWLSDDFAEIVTSGGTLALGSEKTVALFGVGCARPADNHTAIIELLVDDVDAVFARVKAEVVQVPTTMPWGNRSAMIRDPEGSLINLFTPVTEAAKQRFNRH